MPCIMSRLRSSLFSKILVVFALALILIILFIAAAHNLIFKPPRRFESILQGSIAYAGLIARDLGTPPVLERARDLSERLHLQIRFESPSGGWETHPGLAAIAGEKLVPYPGKEGAGAGFTPHGLCVRIPVDNGSLFFLLRPRKKGFMHRVDQLILAVSAFAVLLIVGVWFLIRAQLKPVKTLKEGIAQLSEGHVDHRMDSQRSDELGELVRAFNRMSERIGEMIHARDRLLLDVSHEMRSPLTRIKVAMEFLEPGDAHDAILEDVEEVERMITVILETERLDSPHGQLNLEEMNLRSLVSEIAATYGEEKPGILIRELSPDIRIHADAERVRILLRNLLDNALRHSAESSQPVEIRGEFAQGKPTLRIRDFGSGMNATDLKHIFEPFYRADRSRTKKTGGYGLGMSMCRKIMHAHGGTIHVNSRAGEGTSVILQFPD